MVFGEVLACTRRHPLYRIEYQIDEMDTGMTTAQLLSTLPGRLNPFGFMGVSIEMQFSPKLDSQRWMGWVRSVGVGKLRTSAKYCAGPPHSTRSEPCYILAPYTIRGISNHGIIIA